MSKHITGHTGLLCLLGSPVAHSVSPEMHNEACDQLGLDYSYLAFDVPEDKMPQAVEGLRTMGARGWNITMPGKNIMCKLADKVSPASEISGACNTIVNDNGVLTAYTTDGVGFMRAVAENGVDIIGKKMTLLGAGGAATAILVQAALDGVSEISVFNVRDDFFARAEKTVSDLNERTNCKVRLFDFENSMSVLPARLPCTTSPIRKFFAHPSQTAPFLSMELPSEWLQKPRTPSSPTQRCSTKTSSFSM